MSPVKSLSRHSAILKACCLSPGFSIRVKFAPFVKELRCGEDTPQTSEGSPYFRWASRPEIAYDNHRALNDWIPPFVQEVSIKGDEYPTKFASLGDHVFVRMSAFSTVLDCHDVGSQAPQHLRRQRREVFVSIEPWLGFAPHKVLYLPDLPLSRWALTFDFGHGRPWHSANCVGERSPANPKSSPAKTWRLPSAGSCDRVEASRSPFSRLVAGHSGPRRSGFGLSWRFLYLSNHDTIVV